MNLGRWRIVAGLIMMMFAASLLSGCGGGVAALVKVAGVAAVLPDNWSSVGGMVRILADVVGGVRDVVAFVKRVGHSSPEPVTLTRNAEGQYEGAFEAESNPNPSEATDYTITVTATDTVGNEATSAPITVEVPPAEE